MKKYVRNLGLFTALSSMLLVTACSSSDTSNTETEEGKVDLRFATWDSGDTVTLQQSLVDEFNASQDEIEVTLEAYGGDYDTKVTAGMGAKDAPDVMYMWNFPEYSGALEPLNSYIEKEDASFKDNFYEALWSYNSVGDEIYGLPVGYTTHVLYYNKDLFDQKGIPYPTSDWTWEDLQETSKQLTDTENKVSGFAFNAKPGPYEFEMYLWGNNASYVDEDGNLAGSVDSEQTVEVFEMFQNMEKEGYAIASEGSGLDEMKSGNAAMFIHGAWSIDPLAEAGVNYGVVEIPSFEGGQGVSVVNSSGISISKDSEHKDEAFEFIKFWTNETSNIARMGYELPVLKSVVESEGIEQDEIQSVFYSMLERSEGYTPTSFMVEDWNRMAEDLSLAIEKIFNPSTLTDPKEALSEISQ